MLKILQAKLQRYVNRELVDVQAGLRIGRGTRDQISNIHWIIEKARKFQKNIYFCNIAYKSIQLCGSQQAGKSTFPVVWYSHLLKNLYSGQEAIVQNRHGTTDLFKIGKGV